MTQKSDRELLREAAEKALRDPYYFETEVCEVGKGEPDAHPEFQIRPVLEWFDKPRDFKKWPQGKRWLRYWSTPRFTAKSVCLTNWCAKKIVEDPNVTILYHAQEKKQAMTSVDMIRTWLELPRIEQLFGSFKNPRRWGSEQFTVSQRTSKSKRDPTVQACGMDVPITGWHPDIVIWDDLLGETNNTRDGVAKVKARLAASYYVLRPGGIGVWVCTRWGPSDPAAEILEAWKKGDWDAAGPRGFFGAYAVEGDEAFFPHAEPGKALFPSVWPEEAIEDARRTQPFEWFASQVLNEPIPAEGAYFRLGDFQYFPLYEEDGSLSKTLDGAIPFMAVDPASGKDEVEKGDETAFVVAFLKWVENRCQVFVVDEVGGRWRPDRVVDTFFRLTEKWRPSQIFIESHTYQGWMMTPIERKRKEMAIGYLPIEEVKRGGRGKDAKEERIKVLHTPHVYHEVFYAEDLKNCKCVEQLLRFRPNATDHDDYRDALAMLYQEAQTRGYGRRTNNWKVGSTRKHTIYRRTGV